MRITITETLKAVTLVGALLCAFPLFAKELCQPTGNSQQDVECAHKKFRAVEAQMNKRYNELLLEIDEITIENSERLAELKPKLIAAQRAWMRFRESQCKAVEVWYTNGKLQGALYFDCMRSLAERRIKELNEFTNYRT